MGFSKSFNKEWKSSTSLLKDSTDKTFSKDNMNAVKDGFEDVGKEIGSGIKDVADGIGDFVGDMTSGMNWILIGGAVIGLILLTSGGGGGRGSTNVYYDD